MNIPLIHSPLDGISDEEWQIRCDLAALYRLVAHFRMTDLIYTHISARLPGPEHHFLINQYGLLFHEMRASDLVKIDVEGNVVDQPNRESRVVNPAGFTIHSAIHMARADLKFVVHTHSAAGMAVSAQKDGLLPITQIALKFYNRIAYHGYEGIALNLDERERLVRDLGSPERHDPAQPRPSGGRADGRPDTSTGSTFSSAPARLRSPRWPAACRSSIRRRRCAS